MSSELDPRLFGVPDVVSFGGWAKCPTCGQGVGDVKAGGWVVSMTTLCMCGNVMEAVAATMEETP